METPRLDHDKFFEDAVEMKNRMIKKSWKPLVLGFMVSLVGLIVAFVSIAWIVKFLFF